MSGPIVGVVAEYNPFHKGHLHHLKTIRESLCADVVIVVLSSYFTQRGEPAVCSPVSRSKMALLGGADIVIQLPSAFSCQNAGIFASAAVDLLAATGIVSHISFGMETPEQDMTQILDILIHEPDAFKTALRRFLDEGHSFPKARSLALRAACSADESFFSGSNDILALEYAKRIAERRYPIRLFPVQRAGSPHRSVSLESGMPSAGALRKALFLRDSPEDIRHGVPEFAYDILVEEGRTGRICSSSERLWRVTQIILSRETPESLRAFAGISEGIENRILQEKERSGSFEDLVSACTTRRYARSRIRRTLLHILLGLTQAANLRFQQSGPQYIRILGYTEEGRKALARMRRTAALPLLSRWSYRKNAAERDLLDFEQRSSILWEALLPSPAFGEIRKEHP